MKPVERKIKGTVTTEYEPLEIMISENISFLGFFK